MKYVCVWTYDELDNHDRITRESLAAAQSAERIVFEAYGDRPGFMVDVIPEDEYDVRFNRDEVEGGPGSSSDTGEEVPEEVVNTEGYWIDPRSGLGPYIEGYYKETID